MLSLSANTKEASLTDNNIISLSKYIIGNFNARGMCCFKVYPKIKITDLCRDISGAYPLQYHVGKSARLFSALKTVKTVRNRCKKSNGQKRYRQRLPESKKVQSPAPPPS